MGLPSLHLEHAPKEAVRLVKGWSNHSQPTSAFTFGDSLCEAGEELMVLGQSKWSAFGLLEEKKLDVNVRKTF